MALEPIDRSIVRATQAGLPLCREPYRTLAEQVGLTVEEVMERLAHLLATGVIRRIGAVPNHYALGYRANGMSVWDVDDAQVSVLGPKIGALPSVSHCYRRPRRLPDWPYNLFAMLHGRSREAVEAGALGFSTSRTIAPSSSLRRCFPPTSPASARSASPWRRRASTASSST